MKKRYLVEYELTPEETQQAVLEYIARKERRSNAPRFRHVTFRFPPPSGDKRGRRAGPSAVALTEAPQEDEEL
jgi:hypothetical protein